MLKDLGVIGYDVTRRARTWDPDHVERDNMTRPKPDIKSLHSHCWSSVADTKP